MSRVSSISLMTAAAVLTLALGAGAQPITPVGGGFGQGGPPAVPVNPKEVAPGEFVIEPPTLINLGFEWFIDGDENRNAAVAVSYRRKGTTAWQPALPLLRLQGERVFSESRIDFVSPNMFAGSILDLAPDTTYEAQFVITDPDGVKGPTVRS